MNALQPLHAARAPKGALEWSLVLLIFYNVLFIAPFIFKTFFWGFNVPLRIATYALPLLLILRSGVDARRLTRLLDHPAIFMFLILYLGYMLTVAASSLLGYKEHPEWISGLPYNALPSLISAWLLALYGLIFAVFLDAALCRWIMDRYTDLLVVCAIGAIVLTPLIYFNLIQPLTRTTVMAEGAEVLNERNAYQHFYGLGFLRGYATIGGIRFPRAQSFTKEGGGFAFALMVAMFWAYGRGRYRSVGIMAVAFVLAWSVGAMLFFGVIAVIRLLKRPLAAFVLLLGLASLVSLLYATGVFDPEVFRGYIDEKIGAAGTITSMGGRLSDLLGVWERVVNEHWLGFGAGATQFVTPLTITTSFILPLVEGGLPGMVLWCSAYAALAIPMLRMLASNDRESSAIGLIVLSIYYFSTQRPGLDAGILIWLLVAMIPIWVSQKSGLESSSARLAPVPAPVISARA